MLSNIKSPRNEKSWLLLLAALFSKCELKFLLFFFKMAAEGQAPLLTALFVYNSFFFLHFWICKLLTLQFKTKDKSFRNRIYTGHIQTFLDMDTWSFTQHSGRETAIFLGGSEIKQQRNAKGRDRGYFLYYLFFLMLLISGDIQLNLGPSVNNTGHSVTTGSAACQGVDTQLNTMTAGSLDQSAREAQLSPEKSKRSRSSSPRKDSFDSSTCIATPSSAEQIQRQKGPEQSSVTTKR